MKTTNFNDFCEAWALAHETMAAGKSFTPAAISSIFDDFESFEFEQVDAALKHYRKTAKFAPTAFDIITLLSSANKRLTADEAWSRLPKSERDTVVWSEEMAGAYAIIYDLLVDGDKIAARMAFKGAYDRLCNESVLMQKPLAITVSIGYDKNLIEPTLQRAIESGQISQKTANRYLPAPQDAGIIGGLISGKIETVPVGNEVLAAKWGGLKESMLAGERERAAKKKQELLDRESARLQFEQNRQMIINNALAFSGL